MADTTTNLAAASLTFSVLSFIMLAITLIFFLFPDFSSTIKAGLARSGSSGGFGTSFKMLGAFLGALSPDITLLSGFVSDIINGSFRYSVTSIVGVIAVILHWGVAGLVYGFAKDSAPSVVANAAAAVASAVSAGPAQLLGTGGEPTNPTPPSSGNVQSRKLHGFLRRVPGPGSVPRGDRSVMSEITPIPGAADGEQPSQGINGPTGVRFTRIRNPPKRFIPIGGGNEEDGQTGGAWEIPEDLRNSFNPCSIRGLGMFDISKSPMGMAALSSVFAIYLMDMTINNKRAGKDVLLYLGFSGVVYGLNLFSYSQFKCYGDTVGTIMKSTILPIILGLSVGAASFATLKTTFPAYLPLDPQNVGDPALPSKHATCAPPNDQDQFVCDAYKDGKRVTSAIVA